METWHLLVFLLLLLLLLLLLGLIFIEEKTQIGTTP